MRRLVVRLGGALAPMVALVLVVLVVRTFGTMPGTAAAPAASPTPLSGGDAAPAQLASLTDTPAAALFSSPAASGSATPAPAAPTLTPSATAGPGATLTPIPTTNLTPAASPTPLPTTNTTPSASPTPTNSPTPGFSATPTPSATASPSATPSPTITRTPTITPTYAPTPTITPTPTAVGYGPLDHTIVYDNGSQMLLIKPDGKGRAGLSFLSAASGKRPRFSGGWRYVYYNNGFWVGDIYGHQQFVAPPALAGEEVYDAIPSPDGQYLAWQMTGRGTVGGNSINTAASRIVVTDASGGNAHTLVQASAGSANGDIPLLFGWRPGYPPTVLVQINYSSAAMFGLHKGLQEFDPVLGDMVNDYLPPLGEDTLPQGEVLGLSPSGGSIIYATQDAPLPSGEGPLPVNLLAMTTKGRVVSTIDVAASHKDKPFKHYPAPKAYVFARQAFVSPDDSRIAYTRLDVIYPPGALKPLLRPIACLANLDGTAKAEFGPDERVVGWSDGHTVLVRRENTRTNGIYTVNLNTGATRLVALGSGLRVDGIIP